MGVEEWYIRCIKDYLINIQLMKESDNAEIVLNDSDMSFNVEVHHMNGAIRNGVSSTLKGKYRIDKDYLIMKFKNTEWKVKI